jgi:hypothetical protein
MNSCSQKYQRGCSVHVRSIYSTGTEERDDDDSNRTASEFGFLCGSSAMVMLKKQRELELIIFLWRRNNPKPNISNVKKLLSGKRRIVAASSFSLGIEAEAN